jgi:hypothetical protein
MCGRAYFCVHHEALSQAFAKNTSRCKATIMIMLMAFLSSSPVT